MGLVDAQDATEGSLFSPDDASAYISVQNIFQRLCEAKAALEAVLAGDSAGQTATCAMQPALHHLSPA